MRHKPSKLNTMIFNFKNSTELEHLKALRKNGNINLTLYKKAISYLNNDCNYQLFVNNITDYKVIKVLKVKK
jgi:hypothetical protein